MPTPSLPPEGRRYRGTTSTTDSIFALSYFPADERFLYSSDQGGNELTHIFVRNPDGSTRDLTPGTKLKANFHACAGDDRSLLVSTNERDPRHFDLYEIAADGYARTMLCKNVDGYEFGTISRDKRFIALVRSKTTSDSDWDIVGAGYSRGGRYLIVYVNEDSRFAARVLDAATLQPAAINGMPQGLVRGVSISRDDVALAFYASDGSVPNDLYAGTFAGTPQRLTDAWSINFSTRRSLIRRRTSPGRVS